MYLHENKETFLNVLETVSKVSGIQADLVEKDYYVSLILKEIAASSDKAVFKGGTSLSKALKVINRFSEDIDISFSEHIGASRRKKLKYNIIAPIADKLGLVITNFDKTQSDRDERSGFGANFNRQGVRHLRLLSYPKVPPSIATHLRYSQDTSAS